jgi:hypothetical protein
VGVVVAIGLGLIATRYLRWMNVGISVVGGLIALGTVVTAFTSDPSLWTSDMWRYAGIGINLIGVLGAVLAVAVNVISEL